MEQLELVMTLLTVPGAPLITLNYTVNQEKREKKSTGEKSKESSGDGAPKLQISVPCRRRTCPDWKTVGREKKAHKQKLFALVRVWLTPGQPAN